MTVIIDGVEYVPKTRRALPNNVEKQIKDLFKKNAELQNELKHERNQYQRLATHHNMHCTCMEIY